ncbi:MAG TPA: hypothetical protein VGQ62_19430 [Chloroflexota bacterium]|jgi:maleate isomerase|nr:hypothetical protein [Chloroflexota bacterium]
MLEAAPDVRVRIGLIIPSSNRLTEPQMRRYAPRDVEVHVTRLRMTGPHHVPLDRLYPLIADATAALADARCDVIVFHCTASSMEAGVLGDERILATMRQAAPGVHVATTASCCVAALNALDAHRVILISPYVAATHEHEAVFLRQSGLSITGSHALGLPGGDAYITVTPAEWLQLGVQESERTPTADTIFLSCTNTHTPPVISALEATTGRPVVTSNQAVLWYALRRCEQPDTIANLGRLFQLGIAPGRPADAQRVPVP